MKKIYRKKYEGKKYNEKVYVGKKIYIMKKV